MRRDEYDIKVDIEQTKIKLDELEKELKKAKKFPEDLKLAELIHSKLSNTMVTSSWDYSSWEKPCETRKRYAEKARKILRITSYEKASEIIKLLNI